MSWQNGTKRTPRDFLRRSAGLFTEAVVALDLGATVSCPGMKAPESPGDSKVVEDQV